MRELREMTVGTKPERQTPRPVSPELLHALVCTDDSEAVQIWANSAPCPSVAELRAMFRLTPTQARVARMLVARRTNAEIGSLLGISIHTARRHVEAVLFRMGIGSRWDVEQRVVGNRRSD